MAYSSKDIAFSIADHPITNEKLYSFAYYHIYPSLARDFFMGYGVFQDISPRVRQDCVDRILRGEFPFDEYTWSTIKERWMHQKDPMGGKSDPLHDVSTRRQFMAKFAKASFVGIWAGLLFPAVRYIEPEGVEAAKRSWQKELQKQNVPVTWSYMLSQKLYDDVIPALAAIVAAEHVVIGPLEEQKALENIAAAIDISVAKKILDENIPLKDTTRGK